MDGSTLDEIRNILLSRWNRFGTSLKAVRIPDAEDEPTNSSEMIDVAQALEQLGRDSSLKEVERRELVAVERALAKMATGNFGVCEDCGDEIPSKRLLIVPEARFCAHCQTLEERQNSRLRAVG